MSLKFNRGQTAIEFILIVAFMMVAFVSIFSIATSQLTDASNTQSEETAAEIAENIEKEFLSVNQLHDGFTKEFTLPALVNGFNYSLQFIDEREIVVYYRDVEHVIFLPINVSGPLHSGRNTVTKHSNGSVVLNKVPDHRVT